MIQTLLADGYELMTCDEAVKQRRKQNLPRKKMRQMQMYQNRIKGVAQKMLKPRQRQRILLKKKAKKMKELMKRVQQIRRM